MQLTIKHEVYVYLSTIRHRVEVFKYQEMEIWNEISSYISNLKFLLVSISKLYDLTDFVM